MVSLTEVYQLNERADFQYIASELIKYYGLKNHEILDPIRLQLINESFYIFLVLLGILFLNLFMTIKAPFLFWKRAPGGRITTSKQCKLLNLFILAKKKKKLLF